MASVEVAVPATSANLGPGFDCLGVALGIYLRVRFSRSDRSEITGRGRVRSVEESLIFRSFRAGFSAADEEAPPVRIEVVEDYPSGRGMGASASAIVAGLVGARALGGLALGTHDLARLAIEIEGHPDNVLPALVGGLILTIGVDWIRFRPSDRIAPFLLVARSSFKTEHTRKALPAAIAKEDAVANASATAALVSILSGESDPANLMAATEDRLHQPYRFPLMPESQELYSSLRKRGIAAALSGAGPSLIALVESERREEAKQIARDWLREGWSLLAPEWDVAGARVSP